MDIRASNLGKCLLARRCGLWFVVITALDDTVESRRVNDTSFIATANANVCAMSSHVPSQDLLCWRSH